MAMSKDQLKVLALELAAAMPPAPTLANEPEIARLRDEASAELGAAYGIIDVCMEHPDLEDMPGIANALYGALRLVGEAKSRIDSIKARMA